MPKYKLTSLMTYEQKLMIRTTLANILMRYSSVKNHLETYTGEPESLTSNELKNEAENKFKPEVASLKETWDQIFLVWDKLEEAMTLESVTYEQLEPAIKQTVEICNDAFDSIEKSVDAKKHAGD